jgi:glutamine synthetase
MTNKTTILEYVWLGGNNEFRSKIKVLPGFNYEFGDIPVWNYDGSSTGQADGTDSEIMLHPVQWFPNYFFKSTPDRNTYLVWCQTKTPDGKPLPNNNYTWAKNIFQNDKNKYSPWFGIEQEYFMIDPKTKFPLGFPLGKIIAKQGQYYCSVGAQNAFGRSLADEHLEACLYANLSVSGINAEVAPGQWEYQIGPCGDINSGDQVWISRYILERLAEKHNIIINWHPKPIDGRWNGSGCHTNFSTSQMRLDGGLEYIETAIKKLEKKHKEHMEVYGQDNDKRMTGEYETSDFESFTVGRANRGASIRIGNETIKNKKGYFEDRRPASNMDPYLVTGMLYKTICLDE